MNLHDTIKTILTTACPTGTEIFEVFMAFDARTTSYRLQTPSVVFRIDECAESPAGSGLYRLSIRADVLGKVDDVETIMQSIQTAFASQQNASDWSVSLSPQTAKESYDMELNVDWGVLTLKGVAIG